MFILLALVGWWLRTRAVASSAGLFIYATINLVGGGLSVLPLGWLPFAPEQTEAHYPVHALYALCQLPLLILTARHLVAGRPAPGLGGR